MAHFDLRTDDDDKTDEEFLARLLKRSLTKNSSSVVCARRRISSNSMYYVTFNEEYLYKMQTQRATETPRQFGRIWRGNENAKPVLPLFIFCTSVRVSSVHLYDTSWEFPPSRRESATRITKSNSGVWVRSVQWNPVQPSVRHDTAWHATLKFLETVSRETVLRRHVTLRVTWWKMRNVSRWKWIEVMNRGKIPRQKLNRGKTNRGV